VSGSRTEEDVVWLPSELRAHFAAALGDAEVILLQSAPRAIGSVVGGIDAVIDALLAALGPARTLVVPTFTAGLTDPSGWSRPGAPPQRHPAIRAELPLFDPRTSTPREMGRIADLVWRRPEAHRSAHPVESIAAIGPRAEELTRVHPLDDPMGPRGPWARLVALDARILLLGVGLQRCTIVHHAERLEDVIYQPLGAYAFPMEIEGERTWIEVEAAGGSCSEGFGELLPVLEAEGAVSVARVGFARTLVLSSARTVAIARALLRRDPGALLCHATSCPQCVEARKLVPPAER
jgi:aminoglycoside 3-N-acetyltransferase